MANRDSDPPVTIPPIKNGELVITAGEGGQREATLTIKAQGKNLMLIVTKGDATFQAPIAEQGWSLEIKEV